VLDHSAVQFVRSECLRQERADPVTFNGCAIAACTKDFDVPLSNLRCLGNRLAATTARRADRRSRSADDGDARDAFSGDLTGDGVCREAAFVRLPLVMT